MIENKEIVNIINLASKYPIITKVGIFGSYARGEQTAESDIDILFDYDRIDEDSLLEILNYSAELEKEFIKFNIEHDYISYKGVMESPSSKIRNKILHEVVWIYTRESTIH